MSFVFGGSFSTVMTTHGTDDRVGTRFAGDGFGMSSACAGVFFFFSRTEMGWAEIVAEMIAHTSCV